jgi:hypothetical protein
MFALGDNQGAHQPQDSAAIVLEDFRIADGRYNEITAGGFELALRVLSRVSPGYNGG